MKKLTTSDLRKAYLDFYEQRGHRLIKSDSLVPVNDPSVLFTSAGMNQFKDYFLGKVKDFRRAASCQKCLRTGDLEEVGQTPFHHTFFEMLGNFSFGDYFKKEAIQWAWEFVTKVVEINPDNLWVSVYQDDSEAFDIWKNEIGLSAEKIKKFGPKDNFWPSNAIANGPNGPCGPCSEIYYQKANGESVEVWNLVFTQFNRCDGGVLEPLPSKNIDTGMGLERMSSVLQSVDSNFKIDIFVPIVETVKKTVEIRDEQIIHMIADHARAVTFCICDGVLPSNDGRGYVVRKLIRRCSYLVASKDPKCFLYKIVASVSEAMGDQYPELLERRDNIAQIIKAEEEKYIKNILEGGQEKLKAEINEYKTLGINEFPAGQVVDLYVTYGIPTEDTIREVQTAGLSTDSNLVLELIKLEQDKSRASSKMPASIFSKNSVSLKKSRFVGSELNYSECSIEQIIKNGSEVQEAPVDQELVLVLDETPFYGESGGQVGDQGLIRLKKSGVTLKVIDTKKEGDSVVHLIAASSGKEMIQVGDEVFAEVEKEHRAAVKRAHTATHILQAVLRKVLGPHVQQAGSYVEPDRFRFDFTHFKDIDVEQMESIQDSLNDHVLKNDLLSVRMMSKEEAKKTGAIALFGEKYEDVVRVVSIADYSKEFCGGTHAESTGKIGLILITSESSVGSGLRRIEALTGKLAFRQMMEDVRILQEVADRLKVSSQQVLAALDNQAVGQKSLEKEFLRLQENELKSEIDGIVQRAAKIKDAMVVVHQFKNFDANLLRKAVDLLKQKIPVKGIFFLGSMLKENVFFVCGVTQDLIDRGLSADDFLKNLLPLVGGSGGGRKDFAQGGTKETGKMDLVFKEAQRLMKEKI